jgi:hypothetical protein
MKSPSWLHACASSSATPLWPNPSVKGTSRKRAAPYVELQGLSHSSSDS